MIKDILRMKACCLLTFILFFAFLGCAVPFKPAIIDPTTGQFPTSVEVDQKYIKVFEPIPLIREYNYVYLRAHTIYEEDRFYNFMKDALVKIGFERVYSEQELAQMIIQSGLAEYVTNISDIISLNNLAKATGPFLIMESTVYPVADTVFRFDIQVIDPLTGYTYLEISRIRTNWVDMDTEINYPIINVIKKWHDESVDLPYDKQLDEREIKDSI